MITGTAVSTRKGKLDFCGTKRGFRGEPWSRLRSKDFFSVLHTEKTENTQSSTKINDSNHYIGF